MGTRSQLPTPASLLHGVSFRTIDFDEKELIVKANAQGLASAEFDQLQQGHYWRVERIVVASESANSTTVFVYQGNDPSLQRQRDGTPLPSGLIAVAEYPSYLTIRPTSMLMVQITGANANDIFTVSAQYQLVEKVSGQWSGQV